MISPRVVQRVRLKIQRHGLLHTLHDLTLRAVNSVVIVKMLKGVSIERVDPAFLCCPEPYTPMLLTEKMIRDFARDPGSDMREDFLQEALSKGDECYGISDGSTLAAYGWYSLKPTRIDPPELTLHFSRDYVYMYKGFTHVRYRGQRLHAIGMTLALRHYLSKGFKGLVSYVESDNFDSRKSVLRMGYVEFGTIYVVRLFGRYLTWASRGCDRFGLFVGSRRHI